MAKALTVHERELMDSYLASGRGPRAIARLMGVHRTTVQRHKRKREAEKLARTITFVTGEARLPGYKVHPDYVRIGEYKPVPDANRPRAKAWSIANVIVNGIALGVLASALLAAYHNYIATP